MTSTLIQADLTKWLRDNQWLVKNGYVPKAHAVIGDPPYFLGSIVKRFGSKNAAASKWAASELVSKWNISGAPGGNNPYRRVSKGFMGKTWDGFDDVWEYQSWVTEWATLLLDFVYPGAILAMFGGTRTYHRLAAGLEDAGWEVFDCMMYIYGSGFPKAADIGKLIDKREGAEREVIGIHPYASRKPNGASGIAAIGLGDHPTITAPATPHGARWDGYKSALKPAFEPIVLARAPRGAATYAELAQRYGTGAINVDGGRIGTEAGWSYPNGRGGRGWMGKASLSTNLDTPIASELGRYPANIAFDESAAALLDAQSGETFSSAQPRHNGEFKSVAKGRELPHTTFGHEDSGGASRFFYTAKSPHWEKEAGLNDFHPQTVTDERETPIDNAYQRGASVRLNLHPTLKPIRLIEWLAKLLLPPVLSEPRHIFNPFSGSGSEMIGAQLAGWDCITGIEREAEYCAINDARRKWWAKFPTYEQAQMAYRPPLEIINNFDGLPLFSSLATQGD